MVECVVCLDLVICMIEGRDPRLALVLFVRSVTSLQCRRNKELLLTDKGDSTSYEVTGGKVQGHCEWCSFLGGCYSVLLSVSSVCVCTEIAK